VAAILDLATGQLDVAKLDLSSGPCNTGFSSSSFFTGDMTAAAGRA